MKTKKLLDDFYWIGTLDPDLRIFDILMYTEFGTSYNSYLLQGSEKTAIFETAKVKFFDDYVKKLSAILPIEQIDYIVVSHTEPDHAGSIEMLLDLNPRMKLVGTSAAINFMKEICNKDFNSIVVKEGDQLSLGNKTLRFISAPNLHWPDTMYTYVEEDGILVTCDSFGAHYCFDGITNDQLGEKKEEYMIAMKYYFDVIISPFKSFLLDAIKKIEHLDIHIIATGHGPVLTENPWEVVDIYKKWAIESNPNTKKTIVIPYVSAYGYTQTLAEKIAEGIRAFGEIDVKLYDLVEEDPKKVLDEIYWADGVLFGTPTILGEALEPIWKLVISLFPKMHGKKIASAFGSYGWSGEGVGNIIGRLQQLGMKIYGQGLKVRFKPSESQLQEAFEFGYGFGASVAAGKIVEKVKPSGKAKLWRCLVCGEVIEGEEPPEACPVCGVGPDRFVEEENQDTGFFSAKEEKIIIVGNGAAGTAACVEIRKRNPVCAIEIISEEPVLGYNRPMLTKGILSDIDPLNFHIKTKEWFVENQVKVTLAVNVTQVNPESKTIILSNGETRDYDKLILALGASAIIPPVKGADQQGVYAIRSLADVNQVQEALRTAEETVVIGGGILGLEAAWELRRAGKKVTVIEKAPGLMMRQLDEKGSTLLKTAAEKAGISVITGMGVDEITGDGKSAGVRLEDGTLIGGDLVIFSTGIRPKVSLAEQMGLAVSRSIPVNQKMETEIQDIYACGDCAEYKGINYGIWAQAVEMGKVAGINAVGDDAVYEIITPCNSFSGMATTLFSVGDNGHDEKKIYKTFELYDGAKSTYEKLYFFNNRFCGGILLGDVSRSAKLLEGYQNQDPLSKFL